MYNKRQLSWDNIQQMVVNLAEQINQSNWKPDIIVGITRGGAIPAVMLSQYLNVPMVPLTVSLRDHQSTTSDSALAEQALGYVPLDYRRSTNNETVSDHFKKNILVIDDICDSGATFRWIESDWQANCLPNSPHWSAVWGENVKFACLVNNTSSGKPISFSAETINKEETPEWIEFPWENFWVKLN